eukprot:3037794-Amphidinium_carterae.2
MDTEPSVGMLLVIYAIIGIVCLMPGLLKPALHTRFVVETGATNTALPFAEVTYLSLKNSRVLTHLKGFDLQRVPKPFSKETTF